LTNRQTRALINVELLLAYYSAVGYDTEGPLTAVQKGGAERGCDKVAQKSGILKTRYGRYHDGM
jgi:hypothetical protein